MTTVFIPSHLRSYTGQVSEVRAEGSTLGEIVDDLERRCPGIRVRIVDEQARIRPHIKLFVRGELAKSLEVVADGDVHILAALSGG